MVLQLSISGTKLQKKFRLCKQKVSLLVSKYYEMHFCRFFLFRKTLYMCVLDMLKPKICYKTYAKCGVNNKKMSNFAQVLKYA